MVRISAAERAYVVGGIEANVRTDGRGRADFRDFSVETGLLSQTTGSARVRLGNTDVLVSVKAEVEEPAPATPNRGRVACSVELCTSAGPEYSGRGGEDEEVSLGHAMERMLADGSSLDMAGLCIAPGEHVWVLYIDALVLDSGGAF